MPTSGAPLLIDPFLVSLPALLQVVWTLDRCNTPGGLTLKLTSHSYVLPSHPAPTRMVSLAALAPSSSRSGNTRAPPRLWAATDTGLLLRLRPSGTPVDKTVTVEVIVWLGGWVGWAGGRLAGNPLAAPTTCFAARPILAAASQ